MGLKRFQLTSYFKTLGVVNNVCSRGLVLDWVSCLVFHLGHGRVDPCRVTERLVEVWLFSPRVLWTCRRFTSVFPQADLRGAGVTFNGYLVPTKPKQGAVATFSAQCRACPWCWLDSVANPGCGVHNGSQGVVVEKRECGLGTSGSQFCFLLILCCCCCLRLPSACTGEAPSWATGGVGSYKWSHHFPIKKVKRFLYLKLLCVQCFMVAPSFMHLTYCFNIFVPNELLFSHLVWVKCFNEAIALA